VYGKLPQADGRSLFKEKKRIEALKHFEREAYQGGFEYIAGIDEVGRGSIAGPVVAAAVILPPDFFLPEVDDSKRLAPSKRRKLAAQIKNKAVSWAAAFVFPPYLDKINILNATKEAMRLAVEQLSPVPSFLLIDALQLPDINIRQKSIVKGDSLSVSIACASILAKVERDKAMEAFDLLYPGYGFAKHKGYATREHLTALMREGACSIHRESFEPIKTMLAGGKHVGQPSLFDWDNA